MIEIVDGLAPDTVVVTRGHASLLDGIRVAVRNRDGSALTPPVAEGANEIDPESVR